MGIYIKGSDTYPAVIRRRGAIFEAHFVDLPNCVAVGSSALEAEMRAQSALAAYATVARRHAWTLPSPSATRLPANDRGDYVAYIKLLPATELPDDATLASLMPLIASPS